MLCAAVDIGSNTTRVLVAEPQDGQLRKVMEQRAYTRIDKASKRKGKVIRREGRRARRGRVAPRSASPRSSARRRSGSSRPRRSARRRTPRRSAKEIARGRRAAGRGAQRGGGGPARLHRRDEDARPPGRGRDRRRRRRRRLVGDHPRHDRRRRPRGALVQDRLRRARRRVPHQRSAVGVGDAGAARPHRRLLRRGRGRAARPGRRGRRQRDLAAHAGRGGARVRDPGARGPGAHQRSDRRGRARGSSSIRGGCGSSPPAC